MTDDLSGFKGISLAIIIGALMWVVIFASPAFAQEAQEFMLKLPTPMVQIIINSLGNAPYNSAAPVIVEIQKQVQTQILAVQKSK